MNVDQDAEVVVPWCCVESNLDPHYGLGNTAGWLLYDRLLYPGTPEDPMEPGVSPMIAESWEFSNDGLEMTLSLRDDVTFNDGSPVNADAVKASLERAKGATGRESAVALDRVETIEVVDDYTVRLVLSTPDAALPTQLAFAPGSVMNPAVLDDPSADLELTPPAAAGSGAFALEDFEPGTRISDRRADDKYWDPDANRLAGLEVHFEPQETTQLNGLQGGDFDVALMFTNIAEAQRLGDTDEFDFYQTGGRPVGVVYLDYTNPELSDIRVRQAIAHAIDREGVAQAVYGGTCEVTDHFWAPGYLGHDPNFAGGPYPYDPERAQALLAEAGVEDLTLDFLAPAGSPMEDFGVVIQESLSQIGVTANLTAVPPSDTPAEFINGDYDADLTTINGYGDDSLVISNEFFTGAKTELGVGNEHVTELAAAARQELDPEERARMYRELGQYFLDEVWAIPICVPSFGWVFRSDVVGVDRQPLLWAGLAEHRYLGVVAD